MKHVYSIRKAGVLAILLVSLTLPGGAASPEPVHSKFVLPQEDRDDHDFVESVSYTHLTLPTIA